jgi:hypothetical protein
MLSAQAGFSIEEQPGVATPGPHDTQGDFAK